MSTSLKKRAACLANQRKPRLFYPLLALLLFISACVPATPAGSSQTAAQTNAGQNTLTILAAASLTGAFEELGDQFQANNPGVTLSFNFAGSQQLAQQLANGAPADVFASANQKQMDAAVEAGRVNPSGVTPFAQNYLTVIYPADNPAGIQSIADLAKPGTKVILAAPEVPVGQYSLDFLNKAAQDPAFGEAYREGVLKNVVSYENNVKAVLTKIALGEADAGIVYLSDIPSGSSESVLRLDIPTDLNAVAVYPIALVQDSANTADAQAFVDLVLSPGGQQILAKHGFIPPGREKLPEP